MKILAFTDLHTSKTAMKKIEEKLKQRPDVIVCAGDFTVMGSRLHYMLKWMNGLKKPVILIHGNHEDGEEVRKACKKYPNIHYAHQQIISMNGVVFAGYGGGGFAMVEKELERFAKTFPKTPMVLITHAPVYNTKLDMLWEHLGNKSARKVIEKHPNIRLAICGHFHETAGKKDMVKNTLVVNPGPAGKIIRV